MKEYKEDVTFKYYDMINSFRADNAIKIHEVEENEIAFNKSFFEIEKDLIKNKSESYFRDIDLLEELEFDLRHENLKIVSVNRNLKEKESKIEEYKQEIERLNNIINDQQKRIDKTIQAIDEILVYNGLTDTTSAFGNVPRELKFYLSKYKTLEEFDKLQELKENK